MKARNINSAMATISVREWSILVSLSNRIHALSMSDERNENLTDIQQCELTKISAVALLQTSPVTAHPQLHHLVPQLNVLLCRPEFLHFVNKPKDDDLTNSKFSISPTRLTYLIPRISIGYNKGNRHQLNTHAAADPIPLRLLAGTPTMVPIAPLTVTKSVRTARRPGTPPPPRNAASSPSPSNAFACPTVSSPSVLLPEGGDKAGATRTRVVSFGGREGSRDAVAAVMHPMEWPIRMYVGLFRAHEIREGNKSRWNTSKKEKERRQEATRRQKARHRESLSLRHDAIRGTLIDSRLENWMSSTYESSV